MRSWPSDIFRSRSVLKPALRGRLFGWSGLSGSGSDAVDAFDSWRLFASEVVDVLAVRLSRSLLNLRFVVASAGCCCVDVISYY
jgi:hypothetical protein